MPQVLVTGKEAAAERAPPRPATRAYCEVLFVRLPAPRKYWQPHALRAMHTPRSSRIHVAPSVKLKSPPLRTITHATLRSGAHRISAVALKDARLRSEAA